MRTHTKITFNYLLSLSLLFDHSNLCMNQEKDATIHGKTRINGSSCHRMKVTNACTWTHTVKTLKSKTISQNGLQIRGGLYQTPSSYGMHSWLNILNPWESLTHRKHSFNCSHMSNRTCVHFLSVTSCAFIILLYRANPQHTKGLLCRPGIKELVCNDMNPV